MNKAYIHILSYFLLLSYFATIIPFNIFHHHDIFQHCSNANLELENDPCHVSIYHEQSKKQKCNHRHHLTNFHNVCNFCKVLIPKRYHYTSTSFDYSEVKIQISSSQSLSVADDSIIYGILDTSILGRAPPLL